MEKVKVSPKSQVVIPNAPRHNQVAERPPLNQFHHHVEVVLGLSHLVNRANIRMAKGGGRLCFAEQMSATNLIQRPAGQ